MNITYKDAGVDIDEGNELVRRIKPICKETFRSEVMNDIGSFSAFFGINKDKYKNPVLVSSTDGVGTKLKIAFMSGVHNTVGIDLVAMVVNDLVVSNAEPCFFLDYFACGKLKAEIAEKVIQGIANGCKEAGCALIGGETAELPGFYSEDEYDLAGFGVGIVDKENIIDGSTITVGDVIIGLKSSGLHSNGFSLVRKLLFDIHKYKLDSYISDLSKTLVEELLTPTKIYVKAILNTTKNFEVKGIAHITGGGFIDNIPRILPQNAKAIIKKDSFEWLPIFKFIQSLGNIEDEEMMRTFNCGIGMAIVVKNDTAEDILSFLKHNKIDSYIIGEILKREDNKQIEII